MADDPQDFDFQMSPASQQALRSQTAAFPEELRKAMRKRMAAAGDAAVQAMRAKLLQAPPSAARSTRRGRPHDSRRQTAAGLGYSLTDRSDGVSLDLAMDTSRLGLGHRGFPWAYNRPSWSHPVFRDLVSARQQGRPWLDTTIKAQQQQIEDSVAKSLDDAAATVKGSST